MKGSEVPYSHEPEQQIILWAFGYLTPSKFNQLGTILFSFFLVRVKIPHKMKINWVKLIKIEGKSTKKPDLGI